MNWDLWQGPFEDQEYRPEKLEGMDDLPSNGMIMKGSKETLFHEDMRPTSPMLWPRERMREYRDLINKKTLARSATVHGSEGR